MKYRWLTFVVLAALVMVFAGCSRPETPQEVATEFWQAVAEGKAGDAAKLSTLADGSTLEDFGSDRLSTLPDFGRVVIEADRASIQTVLATDKTTGEAAESARREITTYLVQVNGQWLVDYQRTRETLTESPAFSGLKSDINKLREQFDEVIGRSSEQISEQVKKLAKDFETYSDETGEKAGKALENFGKSLEDIRKQIEKALDEARKNSQKPEESNQQSPEQTAI